MRKITKEQRLRGLIIVPYGKNGQLAKSMGLSIVAICNALKGTRIVSMENYIEIRRRAIKEFGGRYVL